MSDSTDIPTAYALVNGRRAVYIPVTKRPNASTLSVVRDVKANLSRFQALVPDDITVSPTSWTNRGTCLRHWCPCCAKPCSVRC